MKKGILLAVGILLSFSSFAITGEYDYSEMETEFSIENFDIEEDVSLGGGSQLTCTCFGGPGNYRYQCKPIRKTCYGGPGHYPYDCYVCPQPR